MPTTTGPTPLVIAQIFLKANLLAAGGQNQSVQTTFTYRRIATLAAPSKSLLNAAFVAGPVAAILAATSSRFTNLSSNIRWLNDALDPTVTFPIAGAGAIVTDSTPSFAAVFMYLRTALRGRSYVGKRHFPGVSEIDTTGDVLTGAGLTRWQAVQASVAASLADTVDTWNPCVVSHRLSQVRTNPCTVVWNDVTQVVLNLSLGTMLSRKTTSVI